MIDIQGGRFKTFIICCKSDINKYLLTFYVNPDLIIFLKIY